MWGAARRGCQRGFEVTELPVVETVILVEKRVQVSYLLTNIMNMQGEMTDPDQFKGFRVSNCWRHC